MSVADVKYSIVPPSTHVLIRLGSLCEKVYGSADSFRQRCAWEFLQYPDASGIRIYCAEVNSQLVGVTIRHPFELACRGEIRPVFLASNSMVLPEYRGKGIIRALYAMASADGELQLSKGTAEGMYRIMKQIGYQDVVPNTFQVCLLNPVQLVLRKFGIGIQRPCSSAPLSFPPGDIREISHVDDDVRALCSRAQRDGIRKDAAYLQWRYFDIPHRTYRAFLKKNGNIPVALVVLRTAGSKAYLVDLLWDDAYGAEPSASVAFAKKTARRLGASKMIVWATLAELRSALRKNFFFDTGKSPHCSWYCGTLDMEPIDWHKLHIMHGDGDFDYL